MLDQSVITRIGRTRHRLQATGAIDMGYCRYLRSPLGSNLEYLHHEGHFVIVLEREDDARKLMDVLPKRFGKYGLKLHPEKTRLVEFRRPPPSPPAGGMKERETFDLLGFTHYWSMSRNGYWVVMLKTAKNRFSRALKRIAEWCRKNRHQPVEEQWNALKQKVRGHHAYFGVVGNLSGLIRFNRGVYRAWRSWLNRRSQRARVTWERMREIHERYPLPRAPQTLRSLRA
jgi:hypothetical protein